MFSKPPFGKMTRDQIGHNVPPAALKLCEMKLATFLSSRGYVDDNFEGDPYAEEASKRFGVPVENITLAMRQAAKNDIYSAVYGGV